MIEMNKLAQEAFLVSCRRKDETGRPNDTLAVLKHCAGEVIEAVDVWNEYIWNETTDEKIRTENFAGELADIIMCVLIVCSNEGIDIESALQKSLEKNKGRTRRRKK